MDIFSQDDIPTYQLGRVDVGRPKKARKVPMYQAVNRDTAIAMSGGTSYEYKHRKPSAFFSPLCPPLREPLRNSLDLTGVKVGRFTVIGLSMLLGRWVVRCQCGNYEHRRSKAITNPKAPGDRCSECWNLAYLKRREYLERTGSDRESWEF